MTLNDELAIERALGIIEGVSVGCEDGIRLMLNTAVEMITEIMDKERDGEK